MTTVPPYALASIRIDTTEELRPYRTELLGSAEDESYLRWLVEAPVDELVAHAKLLREEMT